MTNHFSDQFQRNEQKDKQFHIQQWHFSLIRYILCLIISMNQSVIAAHRLTCNCFATSIARCCDKNASLVMENQQKVSINKLKPLKNQLHRLLGFFFFARTSHRNE